MKQTVVISGSNKLQEKVAYWVDHFTQAGYEVIAKPDAWDDSLEQSSQLTKLYVDFYEAIEQCDVYFLMNEDRHGIPGYVGPNGTAELIYALVLKLRDQKDKKIYIANEPDSKVLAHDEIESFLHLGWAEVYNQ